MLLNTIVVGEFQVKRSICQGCPLAPLLFSACAHPLVAMLEKAVAKKEICGLCLPNGKQLLAKLLADDSLLFLKVEPNILRKALEIVQLFSLVLGSQCNIEKSILISLTKSDGFDYVDGAREVVSKGTMF